MKTKLLFLSWSDFPCRYLTGMGLAGVLWFNLACSVSSAGLTAANLRCEYLVNPLGLTEPQPRLCWIVESPERGQRQTAYQVVVASSEARLKENKGDLWDSGKVRSEDTLSIVYGGRPLASPALCFWKVKVWDKDGRPSPWSPVAHWSMGPLQASDWKADWIGFDQPRQAKLPEVPFAGAQWIWFSGDKEANAPKGIRVFMKDLVLPDHAKVQKAELFITADDRFWFNLNGEQMSTSPDGSDSWRRPQLRDLTERLKPGINTLRVQVENTSVSPAGLLLKLVIKLEEGQTQTLISDASWRATDQPGPDWHQRPLAATEWPAVKVRGEYGIQPWGRLQGSQVLTFPPVLLRTTFSLDKPVKRATLYASAFGWFDTHVNGQAVSQSRFNPGWTDYTKRVYYRTYDVTRHLRPGNNALGAVLADGWYSGYIGWGHVRDHYGKKPRFLGQLEVEFTDGTRQVIATGSHWKAATGPITSADILMGEDYDARKIVSGWDTAAFNDAAWSKVDTGAELKSSLQPHPGPEVASIKEFRARHITEPKPGLYVLDLGQNFAGVARLKIRGEAGQKITLRFAERLNPNGTIYTVNLRTARATDTYICRGQGTETWEPRFTFHGFQYVEVTGLKQKPGPDTVVGLALSSDTPVAGRFACSDPMLNQLHNNIYWTQRANFIDIPTDCPQRDERLGWTGDAQVYVRTATLNTDVQAFFTKWLVDLDDGQRTDGQFPQVAPVKAAGDDGGPAWADAGVICPWTLYEVYGDRRQLERHYPSMKRFLEFCRKRSTPDFLPPANYHCFGDWLSIKAETPKDVIYEAYWAYCAKLMAQAAQVLGHDQDAAQYQEQFQKIKAAFNRAYVSNDGRIKGHTQAGYVLALAFDLVDGENAKRAAQYLVEDIESRGGHLSTGFIGTKDMMLVLAKIGRNDVAYRLLHNETFPSWGFSLKHGATSIWERWDGWTPEKGFQDPGMNSFAHYSFGAVYQWMVENIGGIRNDNPTYQRIRIAPVMNDKLTQASVSYTSIRGKIASDWQREKDRLSFKVTIPANTTAIVSIPAPDANAVTENGKSLGQASNVRLLDQNAGRVQVEIGSGTYHFVARTR